MWYALENMSGYYVDMSTSDLLTLKIPPSTVNSIG